MVPGRSLRVGDRPDRLAVVLESARQQWQDGARRLEAEAPDAARYAHLCALVEAVLAELPRRVGQHFTLADLAAAHAAGDDWIRDVVDDATPAKARAGLRDATMVGEAAFAAYARGAVDWSP